jgi:hypothetical protein
MVDVDTFLTILYVMVDDFCQSQPQKEHPRPGSEASMSPSEVVTLAIFARWSCFTSERDFYRYAMRHLHDLFPTLPHRSQFNRSVRNHLDLIEEVALHLAQTMEAQKCPYEALDRARPCQFGMQSEGVVDGWPDRPTLDGPTVWDGMRDSACSCAAIPEE